MNKIKHSANEDISWVNDLKRQLYEFVLNMMSEDFTFCRWSYSGDFYNEKKKWGLANLVFAARVLYATDNLEKIENSKIENIIKTIHSFTNDKGYIYDPLITKWDVFTIINRVHLFKMDIIKTRRAETRQSFATLRLLNSKPLAPFVDIPSNKAEFDKYFNSLNWNIPWSAGSHFNHLLFFLYNNHLFFGCSEESIDLIDYAIKRVNELQSKENGAWYSGSDVSTRLKINGAMKVTNAMHTIERYEFPYPKKLIDLCLKSINDGDACDNFNIVFVLYACNFLEPDYRKIEIHDFLMQRLNIYKKHYHSEVGGFSFSLNKASKGLYGKMLSKGLNEPDIHGTAMFIWGLSLIDKVLGLNLGLKIPIN